MFFKYCAYLRVYYLMFESLMGRLFVFKRFRTNVLSLTSVAVWVALRIGAMDIPDKRKIHNRPTPKLGGLAVFIGILVSLLLNNIWNPQIIWLLICTGAIFAMGVVEDSIGIPAWVRLFIQAGLVTIMLNSGVVLKVFPRYMILGELANELLTVIWFVGITNAFNFFDGMDGLASGLGIFMGTFLGAIAFSTDQAQLGWISVAVVGSALGFFPHNFKFKRPAEIFLGESGSTLFGFILTWLAVHGEWAVGHPLLNLSPPLLIFWVLIYGMIHTTISRI